MAPLRAWEVWAPGRAPTPLVSAGSPFHLPSHCGLGLQARGTEPALNLGHAPHQGWPLPPLTKASGLGGVYTMHSSQEHQAAGRLPCSSSQKEGGGPWGQTGVAKKLGEAVPWDPPILGDGAAVAACPTVWPLGPGCPPSCPPEHPLHPVVRTPAIPHAGSPLTCPGRRAPLFHNTHLLADLL